MLNRSWRKMLSQTKRRIAITNRIATKIKSKGQNRYKAVISGTTYIIMSDFLTALSYVVVHAT